MRWTDKLPTEIYNRLGSCTTKKEDLAVLVSCRWMAMKENGKDKQGFTKEDALVNILELLDCNGIDTDLTRYEYIELCSDNCC